MMRETAIRLGEKEYRMKALSCEEVLESLSLCERLTGELWQEDMSRELVTAMCENAVLGYLSIYDGERAAFHSAREVLQKLTLEELTRIFDTYERYLTGDMVLEEGRD
ncbi:hypothetical protein [Massiliimalia massiliensis]|uniref:hypothetical protein n=1 Tax=Massiliimalia massiliensis TaxID=1852384 RepID=UPI00117B1526|nr:hypothetical protein [Massiliimalia massiliensis]